MGDGWPVAEAATKIISRLEAENAALRAQAGRLAASIEALIAHADQYDDDRMRRIRDRAALPTEGYCGISSAEAENILEAREALASSPTLAETLKK